MWGIPSSVPDFGRHDAPQMISSRQLLDFSFRVSMINKSNTQMSGSKARRRNRSRQGHLNIHLCNWVRLREPNKLYRTVQTINIASHWENLRGIKPIRTRYSSDLVTTRTSTVTVSSTTCLADRKLLPARPLCSSSFQLVSGEDHHLNDNC